MITNFSVIILQATKIFAVLGTVLYFIFALIVVKQVNMMTKNISDKFNAILVMFSWLHLLFALFLIFLTLTVL